MDEESCKIALTFLDWKELNAAAFIKTLSNIKYRIVFYEGYPNKKYRREVNSRVGYLLIGKDAQATDKFFNTYDEVIEYAKILQNSQL